MQPATSERSGNTRPIPYTAIKKARKSWTSLLLVAILFVAIQISVSAYMDLGKVLPYRIEYNMFLENPETIEVVVDKISNKIKSERLRDYVLLFGNSVAWGTNESSEHSLGRYLNDLFDKSPERGTIVFNLSAPSMQAGDIYTLLRMFDRRGISTDNVMIGLTYSAFNRRDPGPRAVFWFGEELRKADAQVFRDVLPHLLANDYHYERGWKHTEQSVLKSMMNLIPMYRYKDFIESEYRVYKNGTDLVGDDRPWYEKKIPPSKLTDPQYLKFFSDEPVEMTSDNWGVYFVDRIVEHQKGRHTLFFLAGGNGELSRKEIGNPTYQANLRQIDDYFSSKEVDYMNLQDAIDPKYFTDHVHLTQEGNEQLAGILWERWLREDA